MIIGLPGNNYKALKVIDTYAYTSYLANVCDAGPAFTQPWANVSCLNGHSSMYRIRTDGEYVNDYGTLPVHKPDI